MARISGIKGGVKGARFAARDGSDQFSAEQDGVFNNISTSTLVEGAGDVATAISSTPFGAFATLATTLIGGSISNEEMLQNLLTVPEVRNYFAAKLGMDPELVDYETVYAHIQSNPDLLKQIEKRDEQTNVRAGGKVAAIVGGTAGAGLFGMILGGPIGWLGGLGLGWVAGNKAEQLYTENVGEESYTNTFEALGQTYAYRAAGGNLDDEIHMLGLLALKTDNATQAELEKLLGAPIEKGLQAYRKMRLMENGVSAEELGMDEEETNLAHHFFHVMSAPENNSLVAIAIGSDSENVAREYIIALKRGRISLAEMMLEPVEETQFKLSEMAQLDRVRTDLRNSGVSMTEYPQGVSVPPLPVSAQAQRQQQTDYTQPL